MVSVDMGVLARLQDLGPIRHVTLHLATKTSKASTVGYLEVSMVVTGLVECRETHSTKPHRNKGGLVGEE